MLLRLWEKKKRNTIVFPVEIWISSVTMNVSLEVPQNLRAEVPCYLFIPVLWLSQKKFMSDEEEVRKGMLVVLLWRNSSHVIEWHACSIAAVLTAATS